ncbi:hypothetical protein B0T26DRAFT_677641 [Lasiosphaeria miniovina]|uniref:Zn(2)-C6 fungal-type domain-containing protein n=1 Tax=Lasiosphaeria miniovina TaxID=1954250 RepID=A0AA40ACE5_9PEZI|nr:uncharacterized protein B0T26DRAFT_677641 [Lasiosphaeria miniovina]KAK0713291.1 hypothetical protein B0T26DRAFT_677641 [Lasiosphaeria miniovina]
MQPKKRPERNRIAQACLTCQEKKTRCDGNTPSCSACTARGVQCIQHKGAPRRRGPGRSKEHMKALEERLARMESLIQRPERSQSLEDQPAPPPSIPLSGPLSPPTVQASADRVDIGYPVSQPEPREQCEPSSITNPSPGMVWQPGPVDLDFETAPAPAQQQPGNKAGAADSIQAQEPVSVTPAEKFKLISHPVHESEPFQLMQKLQSTAAPGAISPREPFTSIVEHVIEAMFAEFPLLNTAQFLSCLHATTQQHPGGGWPAQQPAAWTCLVNAVYAAAPPLKTVNCYFQDICVFSWAFFKNAFAAFPELLARGSGRGSDVTPVAAILAMALFTRHWAATQLTALLLSTAARMLHLMDAGRSVSQRLREQRGGSAEKQSDNAAATPCVGRLFWVAYILDVELSSSCGVPQALSLDNQDPILDLPEEGVSDHISPLVPVQGGSSADGAGVGTVGLFRRRAKLAMIQSQIATRLYSSWAVRSLADTDLLREIAQLDLALADWEAQLPARLRLAQRPEDIALDSPAAIMYLVYYSNVAAVHWAAGRHEGMGVFAKAPTFYPELALSRLKGEEAARDTIRLVLHGTPPRLLLDFWRVLRYPIAAAFILAKSVVESPKTAEAKADGTLLAAFAKFIDDWARSEKVDFGNLLRGCAKLAGLAAEAITAAAQPQRPGVQQHDLPSKFKFKELRLGEIWPLTRARNQTFLVAMSRCLNPMCLTQDLLGDVVSSEVGVVEMLCSILELPAEDSQVGGRFVPKLFRPGTYGFSSEQK